jgi:hypothetical protein
VRPDLPKLLVVTIVGKNSRFVKLFRRAGLGARCDCYCCFSPPAKVLMTAIMPIKRF